MNLWNTVTLIKFMIAYVDKCPDITWNQAVKKPDVLGLKLDVSATKVPP